MSDYASRVVAYFAALRTFWSVRNFDSRLDSWKLEIDLTAPPVLLFNHTTDACYQSDVIDETLNAFRTADGQIRMVAGNGGEGPCSFVGHWVAPYS